MYFALILLSSAHLVLLLSAFLISASVAASIRLIFILISFRDNFCVYIYAPYRRITNPHLFFDVLCSAHGLISGFFLLWYLSYCSTFHLSLLSFFQSPVCLTGFPTFPVCLFVSVKVPSLQLYLSSRFFLSLLIHTPNLSFPFPLIPSVLSHPATYSSHFLFLSRPSAVTLRPVMGGKFAASLTPLY